MLISSKRKSGLTPLSATGPREGPEEKAMALTSEIAERADHSQNNEAGVQLSAGRDGVQQLTA